MNFCCDRSFFERPTLSVAQDLIGCQLNFKGWRGLITEVEAYIGMDDPACHASRGKTNRTKVMFGLPGFSYIYLIYGMYYCLNVVTEKEGFPAAVLLRGLFLQKPIQKLIDGPGKLCRELGLTKTENEIDLSRSPEFFIENREITLPFEATPRIGIKVGTDKLWRFIVPQPALHKFFPL